MSQEKECSLTKPIWHTSYKDPLGNSRLFISMLSLKTEHRQLI